VERPVVPLGLLKSRHRGAIMASGFFLSVGNQAFVSHSVLRLKHMVNGFSDVPNTSLLRRHREHIDRASRSYFVSLWGFRFSNRINGRRTVSPVFQDVHI
jgi:hypothetical protein